MRFAINAVLLFFTLVAAIEASDGKRLGLNLEAGSRTSVGVTYRIHDRLSLRPSIAFQVLKADNVPVYIEPGEDFPVFKTTERVLQGGLGLMYFYASPDDHQIEPYLGLDFFLGQQDLPFQTLDGGSIVYRNGSLHQMSSRGFLGVQLPFVRRIALYGEVGVEYSRRERFAFGGKKLDVRYIGSFTSGVGVIFYIF